MNILVAEDDSTDFEFFEEALVEISSDFVIKRAKTGLDCTAILKTDEQFDLIFLDLNMPGYNGIDCLKYIKSNERRLEIPVVIYSTSHYIKNIDTCFKLGAHFYIVKPVKQHILVNELRQVFEHLTESTGRPSKQNFVVGLSAPMEN